MKKLMKMIVPCALALLGSPAVGQMDLTFINRYLSKTEQFFIDGLVVKYTTYDNSLCSQGGVFVIELSGSIGSDSTFVIEELISRSPNCIDDGSRTIFRTVVSLNSDGGRISDGYQMGRIFRAHGVTTAISNNSSCASSCAIAFLGGVERVVAQRAAVIFHAPYFPNLNNRGQLVADCNVGSEALDDLLEYYQAMTTQEQGLRLMDRTLSYCTAEDGWTLIGASAASLFGVATSTPLVSRVYSDLSITDARLNIERMSAGNNASQEPAQAAEWWRITASQGDPRAQYNYAQMFATGTGVPRNNMKAYVWYSLSAQLGYINASSARGIIRSRLSAVELTQAQILEARCLQSNYRDCD